MRTSAWVLTLILSVTMMGGCSGDDDGLMAFNCQGDSDCGGALLSCDGNGQCLDFLTMFSLGTNEWPDQACNPITSFGSCDTNAQEHADEWATTVCVNNGWTSGVWTGNKMGGCGNTLVDGEPSISMACFPINIPCSEQIETICELTDQTIVEFTCSR